MPSPSRKVGDRGEDLAARYLTNECSYRIVTRNYVCDRGELDIIAWDGDVLCFVEVRSATDASAGEPLETIGPRKISRIVAASRDYIDSISGPLPPMRFDAVGVVLEPEPTVRLIQGAFEVDHV